MDDHWWHMVWPRVLQCCDQVVVRVMNCSFHARWHTVVAALHSCRPLQTTAAPPRYIVKHCTFINTIHRQQNFVFVAFNWETFLQTQTDIYMLVTIIVYSFPTFMFSVCYVLNVHCRTSENNGNCNPMNAFSLFSKC